MVEIDKKYLITTDDWFTAPDGCCYKAVFGTAKAIESSETTLGVRTNARSTNWYVLIGNMLVAGCQIHYCIQTDEVDFCKFTREIEHDGKLTVHKERTSRIYNADIDT